MRRQTPATIVTGLIAACFFSATAAVTAAEVRYLGTVAWAGDQRDASGHPEMLDDGRTPQNALNGFGSAIAYSGSGDRYLMLCDRGPNAGRYPLPATPSRTSQEIDDTQRWLDRFQRFDITLDADHRPIARFVGTTLLTNPQGQHYLGLSYADPRVPSPYAGCQTFSDDLRLDPEGLAVAPDGAIYLADEYGPRVLRFDISGKTTGEWTLPAYYHVAHRFATKKQEKKANPIGRTPNHGMEGLTVTPDGGKLAGIMQGPLLQDEQAFGGTACRLVVWNLKQPDQPPAEYLYLLESRAGKPFGEVHEIAALNDHEFLVLETDELTGEQTRLKAIYHVNLFGTDNLPGTADDPTPVTGMTALPEKPTSAIQPLHKTLFLDLLHSGITPADVNGCFPEKVEGLCLGPTIDGRRLLLVSTDNDFSTNTDPQRIAQQGTINTYIFVFSFTNADLPRASAGGEATALRR